MLYRLNYQTMKTLPPIFSLPSKRVTTTKKNEKLVKETLFSTTLVGSPLQMFLFLTLETVVGTHTRILFRGSEFVQKSPTMGSVVVQVIGRTLPLRIDLKKV